MTQYQLDDHKLLHHLPAVQAWQEGKGHPLAFSVGPTRACNFRCVFCAYGYLEREPVFLDLSLVEQLAKDAAPLGAKSIFFSGDGEPLLNRQLPECIARVKESGLDVALNTNGSLLTDEVSRAILPHMSWMRVSVNAGAPEKYGEIHGTSPLILDKVLGNLAAAVENKRRTGAACTIGIQSLILAGNLSSLVDLGRELRRIGVDYFALKPFLPHPSISYRDAADYHDQAVRETLAEIAALSSDSFKAVVRWHSLDKIAGRSYNRCLSLSFFVDIDSRGDVYPCGPQIGNQDFCYGNLNDNAWPEIWNGKKRRDLAARMDGEFDCTGCMPNCRNDAVNRFLWQLRQQPAHVNFI